MKVIFQTSISGFHVNSLERSQKKQLPGPWPNVAGFMEELMEFTPSRNGSVDPKEVHASVFGDVHKNWVIGVYGNLR